MMNIRRILKKIYIFMFKPFFRNGVNVNIGGAGNYRFDYVFAFSRFDRFGIKHNAGFKKWIDFCKGKRSVFDIGAHIGLYSIPASRVIDKEGAIYAIEPSLANRTYLEKHARFNNIDNINILPYLVGERSEDGVAFYESRSADAMNSLKVRKNHDLYNKVSKTQISLDDLCEKNNISPEVIKVDVEGAEYGVLKGSEKTLKKYSPIVFLSIHPRMLALMNRSVDDLVELIRSYRYDIYTVDGNIAEDFRHNEYLLVPKKRGIDEFFKESA